MDRRYNISQVIGENTSKILIREGHGKEMFGELTACRCFSEHSKFGYRVVRMSETIVPGVYTALRDIKKESCSGCTGQGLSLWGAYTKVYGDVKNEKGNNFGVGASVRRKISGTRCYTLRRLLIENLDKLDYIGLVVPMEMDGSFAKLKKLISLSKTNNGSVSSDIPPGNDMFNLREKSEDRRVLSKVFFPRTSNLPGIIISCTAPESDDKRKNRLESMALKDSIIRVIKQNK